MKRTSIQLLVAIATSSTLTALLQAPLHAQQRDSIRSAAKDSVATDTARTPQTLSLVQVSARPHYELGIAQTASQGRIARSTIARRPLSREGELLETVPGMILTQHSGDGKSNQMFVRGFNLDHGTDFQTRIESMPLNIPTHAHGHGYTDLNVVIPELIENIDYKLGPLYAEFGDFGSAGGATLQMARTLRAPIARAELGAFGLARTVVAASQTRGAHTFLLGGEAKRYDGPWVLPQDLRKLSGIGRWTYANNGTEWSLLGLAYSNSWNASDQIPLRATNTGTLSRFGQIDNSLGGETERQSLSLSWRKTMPSRVLSASVYGIRYGFNLWSNFTYQLEDESAGDQFEQSDQRTVGGFDFEVVEPKIVGNQSHLVRVGAQGRYDNANVLLSRSAERVRTDLVRADDVRIGTTSLWTSVESRWLPMLRTTLGLRGDAVQFGVRGDRAENAGTSSAAIASPKLTIAVGPFHGTELYVGGGTGYHSNDARGSTITVVPGTNDPAPRVSPLVRSVGGEMGARMVSGGFTSSVALWALTLDSELLFVGDAGNTEPQGKSKRSGITINNAWSPVSQLQLDADVSFARARFADAPIGEQRIPGAVERVIAAGGSWEPRTTGLFGSLRVRHFGGQPLIEDNSVRGTPTTLLNANMGMSFQRARITLTVLNVLDSKARDVQYYYASRLSGEPMDGVDDIHFHPAEPRQLRLEVSWQR